jgi:hypothetical protein
MAAGGWQGSGFDFARGPAFKLLRMERGLTGFTGFCWRPVAPLPMAPRGGFSGCRLRDHFLCALQCLFGESSGLRGAGEKFAK